MMVKHAIVTSDGSEYPWAYVNSWDGCENGVASV
jgi:hypothetical protein